MEVYKAIAAMTGELSTIGIGKDNKNQQQGFAYRGIDDVYNALAPLLERHNLCILPRCIERICSERQNAKGTVLFYVTVKMEYDFVSSLDGSKCTVSMFGEAMDSGDKATGKACSYAYKYAAFQTFCIPTVETAVDPDSAAHTVVAAADKMPSEPMTINGKRFDNALAAIRAGTFEAAKLRRIYALTADQDTSLSDLEKELKA